MALCAALLPLVACQTTGKAALPDNELASAQLGSMHNVFVYDSLWFGGAPSVEDLDLAQRRGIVRVIDMCTPEESPELDLRRECQRLNLRCRALERGLRCRQRFKFGPQGRQLILSQAMTYPKLVQRLPGFSRGGQLLRSNALGGPNLG